LRLGRKEGVEISALFKRKKEESKSSGGGRGNFSFFGAFATKKTLDVMLINFTFRS